MFSMLLFHTSMSLRVCNGLLVFHLFRRRQRYWSIFAVCFLQFNPTKCEALQWVEAERAASPTNNSQASWSDAGSLDTLV